jgi:excinuclease UvrABC nuclease subunit
MTPLFFMPDIQTLRRTDSNILARRGWKGEMLRAAEELKFEYAAKLRDLERQLQELGS